MVQNIMPMGAHVAPFVRLGPSLVASFTFSQLALILAFLLFSTYAVVSYGALDSTVESLLKFKSSVANAELPLATWSWSTTPCSGNHANWRGVLCYNGNVWGLQLENMNLTGQIDVDSLVPLHMLRTLSFMNNNFQGPMPDWRKLGALKALYLSDNQFSGQIPDDAFKGMHSLKKVYLANNKFTGNIPSSLSTTRLSELSLENNQFTGPIPNFPSGIKLLNVSDNLFEGPIPPSLTKMDPTSFAGNKGLCGKPLGSDCSLSFEEKPSQSPTSAPQYHNSLSPPPCETSATSNVKPSVLKIVIIVLCVLIALAAIIIIILVYRRSRRDDDIPAQLCRTVSSSSYNKNPTRNSYGHEEDTPRSGTGKAAAAANNKKLVESGKLSFIREDRERFELQDLLRASAEVLGSGNFGSSYKAILLSGQVVVVKRFKQMNNVGKEEFQEHMRKLGRLRHPNLLPLVAYFYRKEEKLLVFDYAHNGSLAGRLHGKRSPRLDWATRLKIVKGVGNGMIYLQEELHDHVSSHGHLKSSNVVLDKGFNPLLMDYSLAPVVNADQVQQLLAAYKSPEYAQNGRITNKTDVWCLGILILEILTGKLPAANCLAQSSAAAQDLAAWVNSIIITSHHHQESSIQVFDKDLIFDHKEINSTSVGEMRKLLQIGAACCQEDPDKRLDLKEVVDRIEELKETTDQ